MFDEPCWFTFIGVVPCMTLCCADDELAAIISCMLDVSIPIIGNSMALSNSSVCSSGTGANRLFVKLLKISAEKINIRSDKYLRNDL